MELINLEEGRKSYGKTRNGLHSERMIAKIAIDKIIICIKCQVKVDVSKMNLNEVYWSPNISSLRPISSTDYEFKCNKCLTLENL